MVQAPTSKVSLCGLELANPTILASGLVGISGAACVHAASNGAGAIVPKSIGPRDREGHANPVLTELEGGFLNAVGLPNSGAEASLTVLRRSGGVFTNPRPGRPPQDEVEPRFVNVGLVANALGGRTGGRIRNTI